jgi:DNA-binding transcriptional MerR regulator
MNNKPKLYTVGEMAKLCNVTAEQLRHYDKNKIFSPKIRDENNNYRYYTEQQVDDVLLIKELKNINIPLKTIGALIRNKELTLIKSKLEENMYVLRQQIEETNQRYNQMVDILLRVTDALSVINEQYRINSIEPVDKSFCIVEVPKRFIVSTCYEGSYSVEDSFIFRYAELLSIIDNYHLVASNMISAIFHDHYSKQFPDQSGNTIGNLEIFKNISSPNKDCSNCRLFGGFKAACATHVGHYRNMDSIYHDLNKWAAAQGHGVSGVSFQEFVIGRIITDKEKYYITRIYLPLNISAI